MLYVRILTTQEERALRQLQRCGTLHMVQRARIVLLSARGWSVPAITKILSCCRRTVRSWIHVFHRGGLGQLTGNVIGRPPSSEANISATTFSDEVREPGAQRWVPAIELTVPETRRLLNELAWNKRHCAAFALYWSAYRRYKQALAKRSHYLKRGAETPLFQQVRL